MDIPKDIMSYVEWLTKVVRKKPMFSKQPKYLNSKRHIMTFSEVPWDHCSECIQPNQFWRNAPRQTVPQTDQTQCISTFPAKHQPLYLNCKALQHSCNTQSFQFGTKTWRVAKEGLSYFIKSLPKGLIIDSWKASKK